MRGFDGGIWQGILAPARTAPRVVALLNQETTKLLNQSEVREQFIASGVEPIPSTPEHFAAFIRSELGKWGKAVKASGARVD